jgi:hypothetical protein
MLKKLAPALVIAALAFGCGKPAANTASTSNSNARVADGKIDVKDRVLVPSGVSKSMFLEGEVVSLDGTRAKVGVIERNSNGFYTTGSRFEDFESSEIYEVPGKEAKAEVKAGDIVLAKGETSNLLPWYGAEVTKVDDTGVMVKGVGSNKQPWLVGADGLVKPSEKTVAEFKQSGAGSMLLSEATKHRPVSVQGYTPKVGDKVIGQATTVAYHSGTITSINGTKHQMRWDDPNNKFPDPAYLVIPLSAVAKAPAPTEGQYLLIKPLSGDRWLFAQVTKVDGQSAQVNIEDGTTRTVKPGEYWPLE